jgi:hypothetical protein
MFSIGYKRNTFLYDKSILEFLPSGQQPNFVSEQFPFCEG